MSNDWTLHTRRRGSAIERRHEHVSGWVVIARADPCTNIRSPYYLLDPHGTKHFNNAMGFDALGEAKDFVVAIASQWEARDW